MCLYRYIGSTSNTFLQHTPGTQAAPWESAGDETSPQDGGVAGASWRERRLLFWRCLRANTVGFRKAGRKPYFQDLDIS